MTRHPKNEAFARTSFLHGANAAYIEEMQAQYERNPGSVSDEWRHFFASLQEEQGQVRGPSARPSWVREEVADESGRLPAIDGDGGEQARALAGKLRARAQGAGVELSPIASVRATQDSIRALM